MSETKIPEKLATCLVCYPDDYRDEILSLYNEGKTEQEIIDIIAAKIKFTLETCD